MARSDNVSFGPGLLYQVVRVLIVVLAVLSLLPFLARSGWFFETMSHFRLHLFIVLVPLVLGVFLVKGWKIGLVGLVALAINGDWLLPEWTAKPPAVTEGGAEVTIFSANVHKENIRSDQLIEMLNAEKPQGAEKPYIAILMEIDARWEVALDGVKNILPHQYVRSRPDNFGIAVLTNEQFLECEFVELADVAVPAVRAEFDVGDTRVELWAVHTIPPARPETLAARNRQLRALADKVTAAEHPVIVAGDLNTSPWSPFFVDLLRATGLRDTRLGFGIQATWPALAGSLGIPLDHVLISPSLTIRKRHVSDPIGSDHRPVVAVVGKKE